MSKNNSILVLNESDFETNSKLDTIIESINNKSKINEINSKLDSLIESDKIFSSKLDLINNRLDSESKLDTELINQYKQQIILLEKQLSNQSIEIAELKSLLALKDKKIDRLEQIKSDFKLIQPSNLDNKLKYNQLIRKKITFPFMPLLSYDLLNKNFSSLKI